MARSAGPVPVLIGIGSNIDPHAHIDNAVAALRVEFDEVECAPIYQSPPVGMQGDDFLNTVVGVVSRRSIEETATVLRTIEDASGRDRSQPKFSSRTLDLDMLVFGDTVRHDGRTALPRPEITDTAHVLQPLADLVPDRLHPELLVPFLELRNRLALRQPESFSALVRLNWAPVTSHRQPR